ncbi:MAG: hypothetical protein JWL77_994 [Chthonomonadaceae bacterium]|nr:hypothetical protein [Chthonomonadaceae bacterium]
MKAIKDCKRRRGSILITALVFTVIIALLLAGIGTLTVSHYSRARTRGDYAAALNLADAGINYELYNVNVDLTSTTRAHQSHPASGQSGPYTGSVPGVTGTFTVKVTNSPDNGLPWYAPNPMLVTATGVVNGATRTVSARGIRHGIFSDYGFYAMYSCSMGGGLIESGNLGSNVPFTFTNSNAEVYGTVTFNGAPTGYFPAGEVTGGVQYNPDPVMYPTVSEIADQVVSQKTGATVTPGTGLTWLSTHNDNASITVLSSSDASGTNPATYQTASAGLTATSWQIDNSAFKNAISDLNLMDQPPTGTFPIPASAYVGKRFVFPDTVYSFTNPSNTNNVSGYGTYHSSVLIIPGSGNPAVPRDYYFESISLTGSQAIVIDNAVGPIRIWLGAAGGTKGSTQDDYLNGTFFFTSTDPSLVRIFDAKTTSLNISANAVFSGCVYNYNGGSGGTIKFSGGPVFNGSVIANNFTVQGTPMINYAQPKDNASDPGVWYGFKDQWIETNGL